MADDDIYCNKAKFEFVELNIQRYLKPPAEDKERGRKRKYWIKNKENIKHFEHLFKVFATRDISYIRRLKLFRSFLIVNHVLDKDLAQAEREDINKVVAFSHTVNKSPKSKRDFALDVKFIWKQLFPEKDAKDRIDDTIFPYAVRHLTGRVDKSREKMRTDKFSLNEFEKLVITFADDPRMQALLTISLESLARPQELLGRKIKDVEMHDNYAKIYITEHGKEGVGFLKVIDSFFYLSQWLNKHPMRKDKNAYLFINTGRVNRYHQMTPFGANKLIRERCQKLGIDKPITLYSLKRNGVTRMRLGGMSDLDIQHTARWTSARQIKTYDLSQQDESFKIELIKRGKIKADEKYKEFAPTTKLCVFCNTENGIAEAVCSKCNRPLDREVIEKEMKDREQSLDGMKDIILSMYGTLVQKGIVTKKDVEEGKFDDFLTGIKEKGLRALINPIP